MGKLIHILIVEDEFMISEDIAMRLTDFGYYIEGIADSGEKALEILEKGKTDLALLDININGSMDGIELASIIKTKYKIPFIFLTSFANKAIAERAHQTNPSAYLLKPFNDRQVQISVDMALFNFANNISPFKVYEKKEEELVDSSIITFETGLFLKKDTHFNKIEYDKIIFFEADSSYTHIYTISEKLTYTCSLKSIEVKLPPTRFIRIHRKYIVNIKAITGFEAMVLHIGKNHLPISKGFKTELFRRLSVL